MDPIVVTKACFTRDTTEVGVGMVRIAHRGDGAGEFWLSLWFNVPSGEWTIFKARTGQSHFYRWRFATRPAALAMWADLLRTSDEPDRTAA